MEESNVIDAEAAEAAEAAHVGAVPAPEMDPATRTQAEVYIATIRFIDTVASRGAIQGGEMGATSMIRDYYVNWLVDAGLVKSD